MAIPCKMDPTGNLGLPAGYTRLPYVKSSGTSRFRVANVLVDNNFFAEFKYRTLLPRYNVVAKISANAQFFLAVNGPNANNQGLMRYGEVGRQVELDMGIGNTYTDSNVARKYLITAHFERNNAYWIAETTEGVSRYPESGHYPLGGNVSSAYRTISFLDYTYTQYFVGEIHRLVMGNNGVAKFDLVPAMDSNGRCLMYDIINQVPYYSTGASDFSPPD